MSSPEFPKFKNSFSEEVREVHKTRFDNLCEKLFFPSNQIKVKACFRLKNDENFKLTSTLNTKIRTKEIEHTPTYTRNTDIEIIGSFPSRSKFKWRMKAKEGKGIQFQGDFGNYGSKLGNTVPYFKFNLDKSFHILRPSLGLIWLNNGFKAHLLLTKFGRTIDLEDSGVYKKGPLTFAFNSNFALNTLSLNSYQFSAAWEDRGKEVSIKAGRYSMGFRRPTFLNLNCFYSKSISKFGLKLVNDVKNWDEWKIHFIAGFNFSEDFLTKFAFDSDNNFNFYGEFRWFKGTQLGLCFHTNKKNQVNETFKGYLNYPFNFGLELKYDN